MNKNLEKRTQSRSPVAPALLPRTMQETTGVADAPAASLASARNYSVLRLPPTRAARASRSRGVFLEKSAEVVSAERANWIEVPVAIVALAVAAFALAVCFKASSIVSGPGIGINPGPAIFAATSVAPPFVEPLTLR
jgi:hypothetical protein